MKATQATIYRDIEQLLEQSVPITERFPKSLPYKVIGERLIKNIEEAMDYVVLAFQAKQGEDRLMCIDAMVLRMTSVKTDYRVIHRMRSDIISHSQYARILDIMRRISTQTGAWQKKQRSVIQ